MKNIHLIPTDKPSKLLLSGFGTLFLTPPMRFKNSDTYQHMYITSDEEIKEGDWFYDLDTKYIKVKQSWENSHLDFNGKKIILTTDQDLIKDGVQAIDDEFLEWFVKNPSCEEVKVVEKQHFKADKSKRKNPLNGVYYSYKIIIPKEEPKQETINLDKLESQLDDALEKETKESLTNWLHSKRNEQETLEEAAERYVEEYKWEEEQDPWFDFMEGAKWQQERMYNEEEVFRIIASLLHTPKLVEESSWEDITEWFKQFKKK